MTTATAPTLGGITSASLPRQAPLAIAGLAVAIGLAAAVAIGGPNWFAGGALGVASYVGITAAASFRVEGRRKAVNRIVGAVITANFVLILLPLISVIWTVVERGTARFDGEFFSSDMRNVLDAGGGAKHAMIGTLSMTGIAALISVPLGLFVAIYLVEYGRGRLARSVTTMVDVMTGIPSIVSGLFAFALFALIIDNAYRSALGGGVALAVLMVPVVIRACEEMIRLVPNELREASYALGVPKWKTIVKVVLPTAIAGILTSIMLAVARVIGETAPLLLIAGTTTNTNTNVFDGRMDSLPVFAYYSYATPSLVRTDDGILSPEFSYNRGWTASLTLVMIVAFLFFSARILAKILQPKGLR